MLSDIWYYRTVYHAYEKHRYLQKSCFNRHHISSIWLLWQLSSEFSSWVDWKSFIWVLFSWFNNQNFLISLVLRKIFQRKLLSHRNLLDLFYSEFLLLKLLCSGSLGSHLTEYGWHGFNYSVESRKGQWNCIPYASHGFFFRISL